MLSFILLKIGLVLNYALIGVGLGSGFAIVHQFEPVQKISLACLEWKERYSIWLDKRNGNTHVPTTPQSSRPRDASGRFVPAASAVA